jgi:hypothetical protein
MTLVLVAVAAIALVVGSMYLFYELGQGNYGGEQKPIILYVNQGNGFVKNSSDFGALLHFASTHGFNTVFFQVYRSGSLLFSPVTLRSFVNQTHESGLRVFFAIYLTNGSQTLPESIFALHEDGISLDMSALPLNTQQSYLTTLKMGFGGETAVTTSDMASPLKPDMLVLETYWSFDRPYIKTGVVASVGVFTTSSQADYQSQFQYALQNSDGVMVFDYYGLQKLDAGSSP